MPARSWSRALLESALVAGAVLLPAFAHGQSPTNALPEPRLYDTPWGDFPLGRALPGTRLRLTPPTGARVEVRVATIGDSSVQVRLPVRDSLLTLSFAELRAYPRVEVRAIPRTRDRDGNLGFVVGAVLGGVAGGILHSHGGTSLARRARPQSAGEDVATMASLGALAGYMTGRLLIGGARWRPVTIPR